MTRSIPTAQITEKQQTLFGETRTVYIVADELGEWGTYESRRHAEDRLKARRSVEKAMRTRRANKAR